MHFVHGHRPIEPRPQLAAPRHPVAVAPLVRRVRDNGGRERRYLEAESVGVGFHQDRAVYGPQLELVAIANLRGGEKDLPDAAGAQNPHRVDAAVPPVEVADDADTGGIGGPDGEVDAVRVADGHRVRAEPLVDARVRAFAEQIDVVVADDAAVAVRIVDVGGVAAWIADPQHVFGNRRDAGELRFEDPGRMAFGHRHRIGRAAYDARRLDARQDRAHDDPLVLQVRAENRERVGMTGAGERVEGGGGRGDALDVMDVGLHVLRIFHRAASRPAPVSATAAMSSRGA